MSEGWTVVSNKKKNEKKSSKKFKLYVPPKIKKKSTLKRRNLKYPNLENDIKNFLKVLDNNKLIRNLYLKGHLYVVSETESGKYEQLNNFDSEELKNKVVNQITSKINKCLVYIKKFNRINNRNEDMAHNLLSELKDLNMRLISEMEKIHLENKFYQGEIYNKDGIKYSELSDWESNKNSYISNLDLKKQQWSEMLEKSVISKNKKFTDLFK